MPKKTTKPATLPTFDERLRYTVEEASALLRQSRAYTFRQIQRGEIAVIRQSNRTFVPGSEIARLSQAPSTEEQQLRQRAIACGARVVRHVGDSNPEGEFALIREHGGDEIARARDWDEVAARVEQLARQQGGASA